MLLTSCTLFSFAIRHLPFAICPTSPHYHCSCGVNWRCDGGPCCRSSTSGSNVLIFWRSNQQALCSQVVPLKEYTRRFSKGRRRGKAISNILDHRLGSSAIQAKVLELDSLDIGPFRPARRLPHASATPGIISICM